jgi:hypothetical protein
MLTALVGKLGITFNQLAEQDAALAAALLAEVERREATLAPDDRARPLGDVALIHEIIEAARLDAILGLAALSTAAATTVRTAGRPEALDPAAIAAWVTAGALTAAEAGALGNAVELYAVCGDDAALAAKVKTIAAGLTNNRLAFWTAASWLERLTAAAVVPPPGVPLSAIAAALARRFERLYPVWAILGRLPLFDQAKVLLDLDATAVLEARNPRRFDRPFAALDLTGVAANQRAAVEAAWTSLAAQVRGYPGLELAAVYDDVARTTTDRAARAAARTNGFISAISNASGPAGRLDVLGLDLSAGSKDWDRFRLTTIPAEARPFVTAGLKAYQRMRAVGGNLDVATRLMAAGFSAATDVARQPLPAFAAASGLDATEARRTWQAARRLATDAAAVIAGIGDQLGGASDPPMTRPSGDVARRLATVEGYDALFGQQAFCDCAHCASVLGPAAYFVDLMAFVAAEVDPQLPSSAHPLHLRARRPDLWTTPLDCGATSELVPTLALVNEVLENELAQGAGYAGPLTDRAAVEQVVYHQVLAGPIASFRQPFARGLARVSAQLAALGVARAELAQALAGAATPSPEVSLGLSVAQAAALTTPRITLAQLAAVYRVSFVEEAGGVAKVDATVMAGAIGVDRATLGALIESWFVRQGAFEPKLEAARRSSDSVQHDVEWVAGLTIASLDRLHRLARLATALGQPVADVDRQLAAAGDGVLDAATLARFATVAALRHRLGDAMTLDDAVALAGTADAAIFDARWNRGVVSADARWPQPTARLYLPAFASEATAADAAAASRLAAGLALSAEDLVTLVRYLAPALARDGSVGFEPDDPQQVERYFVLSAANLDRLDWHVRLATLLGLAMSELVVLLDLAEVGRETDLAGARGAVRSYDAWKASGRTLDELAVALGRAPRGPVVGLTPAQTVAAIRAGAVEAGAVTDDYLANALAVSRDAAEAIAAANADWFKVVAGVRVVAAGAELDSDPIVVPPVVIATYGDLSAAIRAALIARSMRTRIVESLASATGRSPTELSHLFTLAGVAVTEAVVNDALGLSAAPFADLAVVVEAVERVAVATRGWSAAALAILVAEPARLGPGVAPNLNPTGVHPKAPWFSFPAATMLGRAAVRAGIPGAEAAADTLVAALAGYDPVAGRFSAAAEPAVATLLAVEPSRLAALRGAAPLPPGAIPALERLAELLDLGRRLGVDGAPLANLAAADDVLREAAADAIDRGAASADPARAAALGDARASVRAACRDALVDALLGGSPPRFRDRGALAAHFLVDVDAGGCATTSRVVAATNAVQEYVHRITLGLERDDLPVTDPAHVLIALSDAGSASWSWRRAYRVWEANRKVFLWPENYLEPSLRDDKTPLFAAFEDAVGQSDLSEASLIGAFAEYLRGLEELASLQIAGAYHDVGVDADGAPTDVLHLIGVTADDPATFYYRSITDVIASETAFDRGIRLSAWHKLDLSIPSRVVSPVAYQGRLHLLWSTVRTRPKQDLVAGVMAFAGYQHTMSFGIASMLPTGMWGAVQPLAVRRDHPNWRAGTIFDPLIGQRPKFDPSTYVHDQPIDDYTLDGPSWLGVWPTWSVGGPAVRCRNFQVSATIDVERRAFRSSENLIAPSGVPLLGIDGNALCSGVPAFAGSMSTGTANLCLDRARVQRYLLEVPSEAVALNRLIDPVYGRIIARATPGAAIDGLAIAGSVSDAILAIDSDLLYLRHAVAPSPRYVARRLGTTVTRGLGRALFERGLDGLLATAQQLALAEAPLPLTVAEAGAIVDRSDAGTVNFGGSFGVYLRELFFHLPMLVADALANRGRHADARRWFHRVFDPTSTEVVPVGSGTDPAEAAHRQLDRVWRYRELRGLTADRALAVLTDAAALAEHRDDPFNPHAIARLRLSAYKRFAFGRYVDNLLDWGDSLFAQFTRETVEEARLLYQVASSLLGPRPPRLGDCGAGTETLTFAAFAGRDTARAAVAAAETEVVARRRNDDDSAIPPVAPPAVADLRTLVAIRELLPWPTPAQPAPVEPSRPTSYARQWLAGKLGGWAPARALGTVDGPLDLGGRVGAPQLGGGGGLVDSLVAQLGGAFCVPPNRTLLARWDRVEDRLWKLHHCRDLDGELRDLALFAPELDPITRAAVAELDLGPDELVGELANDVPPYRFAYLIERAKGFASSLAGFGGALLGALERRDSEALSLLRQEQALAMARLTRRQRVWEVDQAREGVASAQAQVAAAEHRRDFYDELLLVGATGLEAREVELRRQSGAQHTVAAMHHLLASGLRILPNFHSPWAVAFGSDQLAGVADAMANWFGMRGSSLDRSAVHTSVQAGHERRAESWSQQLQAARDELVILERQRKIADLRLRAAEHALVAYDESVTQLEDVLAFERGRVTNLALHSRLATGLRRLYRLAYGHAIAMARLAERAFRYERGDTGAALAPSYWDPAVGGLLAGERLLSDLQALDRRFLETHHRELELDQSFALTRLDPEQLWKLRHTGSCEFEVPEVAFDVIYPGHWKRRLRAVRLTIPCVTAPYVNVGATLTLVSSQVRATAAGPLTSVPRAHGTTVATSTAQADGGVFELSFRDERYLPFEGQGAVSRWKLELPNTVRAFDYASISDVVISLAYSARPDDTRRQQLEGSESAPSGLLQHYRAQTTTRIVSLRDELGASFLRLLHAAPAELVELTLADDLLAPVFRGRATSIVGPRLALRLTPGASEAGAQLALDGVAMRPIVEGDGVDPIAGLPTYVVPWIGARPWAGPHDLTVIAAGGLGSPSDPAQLDPDKVLDVLLVLPVRLD